MVTRVGGARRKTRGKFSKNTRNKGKMSLSAYLQQFKAGDKVVLAAESAYQKGVYYRRFHGKHGIVTKQRGFCYEVMIKDHAKDKTVIVHPVHIKKI